MDRKELQTRLVKFSVMIAELTNNLNLNVIGQNIARQLARASTSPALTYAESQSAESTKDFIHKLSIGLKELREVEVCLWMIEEAGISENLGLVSVLRKECDELISIFVSSINTARSRNSDR